MVINELREATLHTGYRTIQWEHGLWSAAKYCVDFILNSIDDEISANYEKGINVLPLLDKRSLLVSCRDVAENGFLNSFDKIPKIKVQHNIMVMMCNVMLFCYDLFSDEISKDIPVSDKCILTTGSILNNIDFIKECSDKANKKINPNKDNIITSLRRGLCCIKNDNWNCSDYCCSVTFDSEECDTLIEVFDILKLNIELKYLSFFIENDNSSIIDKNIYLEFLSSMACHLEEGVFGTVSLNMRVNEFLLLYHSLVIAKKYFGNNELSNEKMSCCKEMLSETVQIMKEVITISNDVFYTS